MSIVRALAAASAMAALSQSARFDDYPTDDALDYGPIYVPSRSIAAPARSKTSVKAQARIAKKRRAVKRARRLGHA